MIDSFSDWMKTLVAPAVLISLVGGASTAGYLLGRNELSERIAVIEIRLEAHRVEGTHIDAISRLEYEGDERARDIEQKRTNESLAEIKAGIQQLQEFHRH